MSLSPEISGSVGITSSAARFLPAFEQRVAAGLLAGQPGPRSNYRVVSSAPDRLTVHAADWKTAVNVGWPLHRSESLARIIQEVDEAASRAS